MGTYAAGVCSKICGTYCRCCPLIALWEQDQLSNRCQPHGRASLDVLAAGEASGVGGRKSKRSLLEVMADLEREGVLSSSQGLGYSTSIGGSGEAGMGSARGSGEFGKLVGKVCARIRAHSTDLANLTSNDVHQGADVSLHMASTCEQRTDPRQ